MFGLPLSGITNIIQTVGILGGGWIVNHGLATSDQTTAALGAVGTLVLFVYNALNHTSAVKTAAAPAAAAPAAAPAPAAS